jgi:ubiquinol-cytochrome c reductase cytochrome b subunit
VRTPIEWVKARARAALPSPVKRASKKVFPGHGWFLLGEIAMFSFLVLVATGIYLALFYEASGERIIYQGSYEPLQGVEVPVAYASVMDITYDRPFGAVIRQTHHWAALVFVAAIVLHAMRVFFTGAFRSPRRLNWAVGVTLMGLAMTAGFFGLALPHDLLGGTGSRIGHAFAVSIPVIGPGVADLVFAGEFDNPQMLHRFWVLHVIVLPIVIGLHLAGHLALIWFQTHTQFRGGRRTERNVVGSAGWPGYAVKTTGLVLLVAGTLLVMGATLQIAPIWLYGPFEPAAATVPAQPDWYLGWVEGALRIFPPLEVTVWRWEIPSPFFTGLLLPLLVFAVLYLWPFLEGWVTGDHEHHHITERPRDRPVRTALGVAGLTFLTVLLFAGSHDLQALLVRVPVDEVTNFYRVTLMIAPVVAGWLAYSICTSLVRSERDQRGQPDLVVVTHDEAHPATVDAPTEGTRAAAGGPR